MRLLALVLAAALAAGCGDSGGDATLSGSDGGGGLDTAGGAEDTVTPDDEDDASETLEDASSAPDDAQPDAGDDEDAGPDDPGPDDAVDAPGDDTDEPGDPPEPDDPSAAMFELDAVLVVDVTMDPEDWDALRAETRTFLDILLGEDCMDQPFDKPFTTFRAEIVIDGEVLPTVGIRKKGFFGSLSDTRPSLKVKLDEYEDGYEYAGLERLTLNNNNQDPSNLNTCLTYRRYAAAGHPAPRCGFASVTVNGEHLGIYSNVESIKKRMLRRHFEDDSGNLYEGTLSDFRPSHQGTFEKKTNKSAADFSDIQAVVDALALPGDAWLPAIEGLVDLDRFLTHWALEVLVGHWDGYTGNTNNFWMYADPAVDGRFVFLPWGPDATFAPSFDLGTGEGFPPSVMANSLLSQKLYGVPWVRAQYHARLQELLDTIWDEAALAAEVDQMVALVKPHQGPGESWEMGEDVPRIHGYIATIREAIEQDMADGGPDWDVPLDDSFCWASVGEAEVAFETTWGTKGHPAPFDISSGTVTTWDVGGTTLAFDDLAAVAGPDDEEPWAGNLGVMGMQSDGVIEALWIVAAKAAFVPGGSAQLDFEEGFGYRFRLEPPWYNAPVFLGYIVGGEITFSDAGTTDGASIVGVVSGGLYDEQGDED